MTTQHPHTYRVCIWPTGEWCYADDIGQFEYSRPGNYVNHQVVLVVLSGDDPAKLVQDYVTAEVQRLQA